MLQETGKEEARGCPRGCVPHRQRGDEGVDSLDRASASVRLTSLNVYQVLILIRSDLLLRINQTLAKGSASGNRMQSIVMPDKATVRPDASREEIISYHEEQGTLPRPFAPFSFALNATHGVSPSVSSVNPPSSRANATIGSRTDSYIDSTIMPPDNRASTLSFSASAARMPHAHARQSSVFSALRDSIRDSFFNLYVHSARSSARLSTLSSASSAVSRFSGAPGVQMRRVRQTFTPILPDEPTLVLGERVALMRAFDDGWVVIGRDKPYGKPGEVELGTVPAWCFIKPLKGLRSERPVRSASLGVTVQVELDGPSKPRDDIISWSNF